MPSFSAISELLDELTPKMRLHVQRPTGEIVRDNTGILARSIAEGTINLKRARALVAMTTNSPLEVVLHHPLVSARANSHADRLVHVRPTARPAWGITATIQRSRGVRYELHIPAHYIWYDAASVPAELLDAFVEQQLWQPSLAGPHVGVVGTVRALADIGNIESGVAVDVPAVLADPKAQLSHRMDRVMAKAIKPSDFLQIRKTAKETGWRSAEHWVNVFVPMTRKWESYETKCYFGHTSAIACQAALDDVDLWKRLSESLAYELGVKDLIDHNLALNHGYEQWFLLAPENLTRPDCNIGSTWRKVTAPLSSQFEITLRIEPLYIRFPQDPPDLVNGRPLPHNLRYFGGKPGQGQTRLERGTYAYGSRNFLMSENFSKLSRLVSVNHFCPSIEVLHLSSGNKRRLEHGGNHLPSRESAVLAITEVAMQMGMVEWMQSLSASS